MIIFALASFNIEGLQREEKNKFVLVVQGGAGAILKNDPEREAAYMAKFKETLQAGYEILDKGGSAMDAVEKAIIILEDSPLYNAGKGSVFTNAGTNEMDASIMDGQTLKAGAVCGTRTVKNPIRAARLVMEKSPHVMLCGKGADEFAGKNGLEIVDTSYFFDEYRYKQWQRVKDQEQNKLDHSDDENNGKGEVPAGEKKYGTVGAVALDKKGNLAAATSTGGMTNKRYGRVGDSPIIGSGTYADNASCAVSCTGHGEYFIRTVAAHSVCDLVKYKKYPVEKAAWEALDKIKELGGDGGMIVLDNKGNFTMPFNTPAMIRGYVKEDGQVAVEIF